MKIFWQAVDVFQDRYYDLKARWSPKRDEVGQSPIQLVWWIVGGVLLLIFLVVAVNILKDAGAFD